MQLWDFFQGTQEQVWTSSGKRAVLEPLKVYCPSYMTNLDSWDYFGGGKSLLRNQYDQIYIIILEGGKAPI